MREKESLQTELDSLFHMKIITGSFEYFFFILYLTINNNKSFVRKVDLQDDFYQAMEMKQLELSVLQFKHQVLQASS